jgi:hypothetical protein
LELRRVVAVGEQAAEDANEKASEERVDVGHRFRKV